MQQTAVILFGSNVGDREATLLHAFDLLEEKFGKAIACSSWYQTAPWGMKEQADFLNFVALFTSTLDAHEVLEALFATENKLGRKRELHWGPRTIDLDLLFLGDQVIHTPELQLPHPALQERRFTLIPLNEIIPDWIHPVAHKSIRYLLENCRDTSEVNIFTRKS